MNDPTLPRACADYEHDLVDLHDGALAPEQARTVRLHVERCARCRAWVQTFAALDAQLAAGLPRPALSANFRRATSGAADRPVEARRTR